VWAKGRWGVSNCPDDKKNLPQAHTHTHTHRDTHTNTHTHIHTHTHTYTQTNKQTNTHTHTHINTHAHAHIHRGARAQRHIDNADSNFVLPYTTEQPLFTIFTAAANIPTKFTTLEWNKERQNAKIKVI
jgi:hypothetical protein